MRNIFNKSTFTRFTRCNSKICRIILTLRDRPSRNKNTLAPPLEWIGPRQFVPEVSFTLCNKVILPPLRCAREPDSVTRRQMTSSVAHGPAAVTYTGLLSVFLTVSATVCTVSFGVLTYNMNAQML